jgi:hypothetical protein
MCVRPGVRGISSAYRRRYHSTLPPPIAGPRVLHWLSEGRVVLIRLHVLNVERRTSKMQSGTRSAGYLSAWCGPMTPSLALRQCPSAQQLHSSRQSLLARQFNHCLNSRFPSFTVWSPVAAQVTCHSTISGHSTPETSSLPTSSLRRKGKAGMIYQSKKVNINLIKPVPSSTHTGRQAKPTIRPRKRSRS